MLEYYSFEIKSQKHLFNLLIYTNFAYPNMYFQIHKIDYNSVKIFWRKVLEDKLLYATAHKIAKSIDTSNLTLSNIILMPEFKKEMDKINPVQSVDVKLADINTIIDFYNTGIPKYFKPIHGFDGHSFELLMNKGEKEKYHFWCIMPIELKSLVQVINLIVNYAGLDEKLYGATILK